jgi:hypothetical protein
VTKINVIDIETYGRDKLIAYCCCIVYKNKKIISYGDSCIKKIFEYIFANCDNFSIFFAHNLTFDGLIILNSMDKNIEIVEKGTLLRGCSIYSMSLKKNNKIIKFQCSSKIFPLPLKDIANRLNLPKKMDLDHNNISSDNYMDKNVMETVIEYCKRDVYITQLFLTKINDELKNIYPGWWIWSYTISGLALKIFDSKFNKFIKLNIGIDDDNLIRPAYYGGRCEVFGNPLDDDFIFHYDFSGMYTNRLKDEFPYGDFIVLDKPKSVDRIGFYHVKVKSDINPLPILPYRCEITKKLLFPNGVFSGLYWYEELDLFLKNGGVILEIYSGIIFKNKEYIFKDFSDFCIENRLKSQLNKILWKLIPNSFIGRLGLRGDYEKTIILDDDKYNPFEHDVISDKKINNQWLVTIRCTDDHRKTSNNVIYPAIITSKARIVWWLNATEIIKNGGRLLYCDTDSMFASFKRNIIGEKHGSIEWVDNKKDTIIDKACFAGNKAYAIKVNGITSIKIKGIKDNNISFNEFEDKFYRSESINFKFDLFEKKLFNMKISEIIKKISFINYDKRMFKEGKKNTDSITIFENTLLNEKH